MPGGFSHSWRLIIRGDLDPKGGCPHWTNTDRNGILACISEKKSRQSRMNTETHFIYILILLAILISRWPILRILPFDFWQRGQTPEKKAKTVRPLKPKTPDDCPICREEKTSPAKEAQTRQPPRPWSEVRNRRGRKKGISTQGNACNNRECVYFHIMDESIHALVGYGHHGKNERIQDLICQACGKKFTVRRDTVLYQLKSYSEKVALALALLAEGMDVSDPIFREHGHLLK